jgi:ADP-dependent NAD(P)H-hydrate dehydratase / NAD(P)H-hydrate epimerase
LAGSTTADVQKNRLQIARDFAQRYGVHLALKGYRTLATGPDGVIWVNPNGNPGMASGGTGDVLTGLVAGFMGQFHDRPVTEVVAAAVYVHGLAGDLAAVDLGEMSMLAGDLLNHIPAALKRVAQGGPEIIAV